MMGKSRDFRESTLERMRSDLVDKNPDWDGLSDSLWSVFSFNKELDEDLGNFDAYMRRILEINDITAARLEAIVAEVHEIEYTYRDRVWNRVEELREVRAAVQNSAAEIAAETHRVFTIEPLMRLFGLDEAEAEELFADTDRLSQALADMENRNHDNMDTEGYVPGHFYLSEADRQRVEERRAEIAAIGDPLFMAPGSRVSSLYGVRPKFDDRKHHGIDIAAPLGSPIYSMWGGEVIEKGWNRDYGNYVIIRTMIDGEERDLVFMHMQKPSPLSEGHVVVPGSQIGGVGNTANPPVGVHLHFEVRETGGDTYGYALDENGRRILDERGEPIPLSVNPSEALNPYYEHPEITDKPVPEDDVDADKKVYYYDEEWSYDGQVAGMNAARNEERWPGDE